MAVLLDTGILYALADSDDRWHVRARDYLQGAREAHLVPVTVIVEVTYLLHTRLGPDSERRFVQSLAKGELPVEPLSHKDLDRCDELLGHYPELGFVDVSLIAMAERLRIVALATTDRRHFARVRPRHTRAFRLMPE